MTQWNEIIYKNSTIIQFHRPVFSHDAIRLGFPTGRDSATFRDSGTGKTFLSRDKGTTGQAQNLATGRDGPGFFETVPSRPGTSRGTKLPSIFAHLCRFQRKI